MNNHYVKLRLLAIIIYGNLFPSIMYAPGLGLRAGNRYYLDWLASSIN